MWYYILFPRQRTKEIRRPRTSYISLCLLVIHSVRRRSIRNEDHDRIETRFRLSSCAHVRRPVVFLCALRFILFRLNVSSWRGLVFICRSHVLQIVHCRLKRMWTVASSSILLIPYATSVRRFAEIWLSETCCQWSVKYYTLVHSQYRLVLSCGRQDYYYYYWVRFLLCTVRFLIVLTLTVFTDIVELIINLVWSGRKTTHRTRFKLDNIFTQFSQERWSFVNPKWRNRPVI